MSIFKKREETIFNYAQIKSIEILLSNLIFIYVKKHITLISFADDGIIYKTMRNKEDTQKIQEDFTVAKWQ